MTTGAIQSGVYPNTLAEIGIGEEEARKRVEQAFETIFFDPEENFCHHTEEDAWCMVDTGNIDARTEGMSYGMMMCVQMDRKDIFDRLWTFTDRYMRLREGPNAGYFAWSVQLDGKHNAEGPAPDGEEYFAMALFMASGRWGDGEGILTIRNRRGRSCAMLCISMRWLKAENPCGNRKTIISGLYPI